ncbi:MAG: Dps family protein [Opitutales bacterium]
MDRLDYISIEKAKAEKVIASLNQLLADFQICYTNMRGFHWNVTGRRFFSLHKQFEDLYNDLADKIDEIAERILMLGACPENRFSKYLEISNIQEITDVSCDEKILGYILDSYKDLIKAQRQTINFAEEAQDLVTADLLTTYLSDQEKSVWMITALMTENCKI